MRDGFKGGMEIEESIQVAKRLLELGAHGLVLSGGFVKQGTDVCDAGGDACPFNVLLHGLLVAEVRSADIREVDDSVRAFQRSVFPRRCVEIP